MNHLRTSASRLLYSAILLLCCVNRAATGAEGNASSVDLDRHIHLVKNDEGVVIRAVLVGSKVTDDDLALLKDHPTLRIIECYATSIRGSGFRHLVQMPELTAVALFGSILNDEAAPYLAKMRSLRKLEVQNVLHHEYASEARHEIDAQFVNDEVGFTDEGLSRLLENRHIVSLWIPAHRLSQKKALELLRLDRFRELGFEGCDLSDVAKFQYGDHLEKLSFACCRLNNELLKSLAVCQRLKGLQIAYSGAAGLDISLLSKVRQLRYLILRENPDDKLETAFLETALPFTNIILNRKLNSHLIESALTQPDVRQFACMRGIVPRTDSKLARILCEEKDGVVFVHYESVNWNDRYGQYELYADLQLLLFLDCVERVTIVGNRLRPDDQQLLLNLENRKGFDLADTRIGDEFVKSFCTTGKSSQTIEELLIEHNALTDACLPAIAKLPALTRLSLAWNPITDAGIKTISGSKRIQELYLYHCRLISDAALDDIAQMPALKTLCVDGTGVTKKGLERFEKLRPDVEIFRLK